MVRAENRRCRAVRWAAVPVAAAAALAVAGCGTQLGAAALYGNQRVSATRLADEVANLNAGYQKYKAKAQIPYTQADEPREALGWLLRLATMDQVAVRRGIHVTQAQAQAELAAEDSSARQAGDTLVEVAVLSGLPPDLLPQVGRWLAIQAKLARQLDNGVTPTTSAGQTKLNAAIARQQCLAAKSLDIKVNPQYGALNYGTFAVQAAPSTLSALPGRGSASPPPAVPATC